jgi:FkbM family methyltransferase
MGHCLMAGFRETQIKRLFRAPNYVRAFGLWPGLKLLLSVERPLPHKSGALKSVAGPGFPAPITLRETVSDHATFWQCLVMRQYDLSPFRQTDRLLEQYQAIRAAGRRPVIIDAGGNIGLAAFWFAKNFPEAVIISVEPDADNFALLKRNVAVFGDRVIAVHGAVTETPQKVQIANPEAGASAFQVKTADSESGAVEGFTIESLAARVPDGELFIVKLDIEGSQKNLFADNTGWIDRAQLVILEFDDWQFPWTSTSETFFREMSKRRFDYLMGGESLFCYRHVS